MGIGTGYPSASLHISSSITGSQTDLIRVQNDIGVPIFKVKPDRLIIRNSGSSASEVTMSVDSDNNLMYLKGSIPGSKNTEVIIKKAVKNIRKLTMNEKIEIIEKKKKTPEKKKK